VRRIPGVALSLGQRLLPVRTGPAHLNAGARRRVVSDRLAGVHNLPNADSDVDLLGDVVVVSLHRTVQELESHVWLARVPVLHDPQHATVPGRHNRLARSEVNVNTHVGPANLGVVR
jgi:hypothetical protein